MSISVTWLAVASVEGCQRRTVTREMGGTQRENRVGTQEQDDSDETKGAHCGWQPHKHKCQMARDRAVSDKGEYRCHILFTVVC